jgi:hypothetical protein
VTVDPRDWEGNVFGPGGEPAPSDAELDAMAEDYADRARVRAYEDEADGRFDAYANDRKGR